MPCSINGCNHGTHVAGIAAGNNITPTPMGEPASGVAKDGQVIAIQVFSNFNNATTCAPEPVPCIRTFATDQILGLQRVQELNETYNIAAANMSLGGGSFIANCDTDARKNAVDNLRSYLIATVVSSGNGFNPAMPAVGISAPACISTAVSVGSTRDANLPSGVVDTVSDFSQTASFLTLLAPGETIQSSVPGTGYANLNGTSMAAPHVAGSWAILKQRVPNASVKRILDVLTNSGIPITDTRVSNIATPRIQVDTALLRLVPPVFDFNGDDLSDISVYRPTDRTWYFRTATGGLTATQFGLDNDRLAPADYDGDGRTDIAVFRPSEGRWYVRRSSNNATDIIQWGVSSDVIAPADFDGDGLADHTVFRPSEGRWYIRPSRPPNTPLYVNWGLNGDIPVPGDYDGDTLADAAVFRPTNGTWYIQPSSGISPIIVNWGLSTDRIVPADYDADGVTDIAVWRPSTGTWYILRSQDGVAFLQFGQNGDLPVPADYDGDRRADVAAFRPSMQTWYLQRSSQGFLAVPFGLSTDIPIPKAYIP